MSLLLGVFALTLIAGLYTFGPIKIVGFKNHSADAAQAPTPTPQQPLLVPLDHITKTTLPQPPQTVQAAEPAPAKDTTTPLDPARIETTWRDWMARHNITKSAMALGAEGSTLHTAGLGRDANTPYSVASLSKAVTAMCLNTLLEASPHNWDTPLSALDEVWSALDMAPHPALAALPLSALATHTSGLPKNIDADETAGEGRNLYTQINFARSALREPAHLGASRKHIYSNVNYALLGQIIEGLSGKPYGDTCYATTMAPAGATGAQVGGRMWATAGFGGWSVSATDYLRFMMHWHSPARPWVADPAAFAYDRKSGAGLGLFHRFEHDRHTMNHTGLWRSKTPARRIGAMVITSASGAVFVANWQGSQKSTAYTDLRKSITAALH